MCIILNFEWGKMDSPTNRTTYYNATNKTYTATLAFPDGSTLVIAAEGIVTDPRTQGTTVGNFKRAILFGKDDTLEAVVEITGDGFGFRTRGRLNQRDLADYLVAAKSAGLQTMADYIRGRIDTDTWKEREHQFWMITSIREPPQEVVEKLMTGELGVLPEPTQDQQ